MFHVPRPEVLSPVQHWLKSLKDGRDDDLETEMKIIEIEEYEDPNVKTQREEEQKIQQQKLLELLGGIQS
jgi:hypothetical protein